MTKILNDFKQISNQYKSVFCDLWGCLHNGKESFQKSLDALLNFKKNGFVIMSFSLLILFILEYLLLSKWLIILVAIICILGAIGMITSSFKK